jgi:hypothetical protein
MGEPAYGGADGPRPEHPAAAVLDPRKLIWADVRHALVFQAEACARSAAELACRPDDAAALQMARLCVTVLERLGEMACQWKVGEALLEAERKRAFDEGWEACKAQRHRLEVVPGGR